MAETTDSIDPKTLRPGDVALVRAEVLADNDRRYYDQEGFAIGNTRETELRLLSLSIVSVEPREIKVGDRVRIKVPPFGLTEEAWVVKAIDGDWAWLDYGNHARTTKVLHELELAP